MFNGKVHYKWPFSIAMLVHQRVFFLSLNGNTGSVYNLYNLEMVLYLLVGGSLHPKVGSNK